MKRIIVKALGVLVSLEACAAGWDGAYIGGKTAEGKCFYAAGETMTFRLQVGGVASLPEGDWRLKWTRTGDDGVTTSGTAPVSLAEPCEITTSLDRPGFVRIQASVVGAPDAVRFDGGAGVDFAGIVANRGEPADFEGFWRSQLAALGKVAIAPVLKEVASPKSGVRLYTFSLGCTGGRPSTGYLTVPDAAGPFPARLMFYGYNESWTTTVLQPPAASAISSSEIQLRVNAHGLELGRESAYYAQAKAAVSYGSNVHGWNPADNAEPETCYYLGMALRDVRAAQYAQTLEKWNGTDLIVSGGSQGAFQSMLVASLCPKVTRAEVYINWMCDLRGKAFGGRLASEFQPEYRPGLDYFDEVFHARRINANCHVDVTRAGLGDYISPPTGIACFYNALRCKKRIVFVQNAEHSWTTSAPGNPSFAFAAEKPDDPGPDVDWRDVVIGSCAAADGYNFGNALVTVSLSDAGAYGAGGMKLRLTVRDRRGESVAVVDRDVSGPGDCVFDTAQAVAGKGVVPGGDYTYGITLVNAAGETVSRGSLADGAFLTGRMEAAFFAHAQTDETAGGAWAEKPPIADGRYQLKCDDPGRAFEISSRRAGIVRIVSRVRIAGGYDANELETLLASFAAEAPRGGLLLVDDGAAHWARVAAAGQDGRFSAQCLFGAEEPEEGGEYEIVMETDTRATPPCVSYLVGPVGGPSVRLADADGASWFPIEGGDGALESVCYRGEMGLAALDGEHEDPSPLVVGESALELKTNVRLDPSVLAEGRYALVDNGYRFRWTDGDRYLTYDGATGRYVVSATAPANGLGGFANYVLGLDAADATSKPVLDIVAKGDGFLCTLRQRNGEAITPRAVPGLSVRYVLESADNVGFTGSETGAEQVSPAFDVAKVGDRRFYRARIRLVEDSCGR